MVGNVSSAQVQRKCGYWSTCIISANSSVTISSNLNVFALVVRGNLVWTDKTQSNSNQWICAGYIAVEGAGKFHINVQNSSQRSFIYIKDNGAVHATLRTRAFGGVNTAPNYNLLSPVNQPSLYFPTIDISGPHKYEIFTSY